MGGQPTGLSNRLGGVGFNLQGYLTDWEEWGSTYRVIYQTGRSGVQPTGLSNRLGGVGVNLQGYLTDWEEWGSTYRVI